MSANDGGPAFPLPVAEIQGIATHAGEFGPGMTGMSLRDYFAAQALNGVLSDPGNVAAVVEAFGKHSGVTAKLVAACYDFADAMLKARQA